MALIKCPECGRQISDKAKACPGCGYAPEQSGPNLGAYIAGYEWSVRSATMGDGVNLEAEFTPQGTFAGMLYVPAADYIKSTQRIQGRWSIAGPLLILQWAWTENSGMTFQNEVPIELTSVSDGRLSGIDKWFRAWEFDRL